MTTPNTQKLTIHTHTDLIEVLPLFAGYQPTNSLVVLFITGDGLADKAARIDLSLNPAHLAQILTTIGHQAARLATDRGPGSIHAVAYSDDTHTADHTLLFLADNWPTSRPNNRADSWADSHDAAPVLGLLATASHTTWAAIDPDQPTVPTNRQPYPTATSVLAAQAAYLGSFREYDHRDDLAATLTPPDAATAAAFDTHINARVGAHIDANLPTSTTAKATRPNGQRLDHWVRDWMTDWISGGYPAVTESQAAELTVAVQNIDARDTAWMHISIADARYHLDLWRHIARLVDGPLSLPVLGLTGMAAWINGNGTLVNIALDRAHTIPEATEYTLLGLLEQIITAGLPPTAWTKIRTDFTRELHHRTT